MYTEINDFLYVGSANSVKFAHDFDLIVNCTTDIREPKQYENQFIRLPMRDDPDCVDDAMSLLTHTNVLSIIHETIKNNKRVLVHCYAGEQRSCAVVACYLIRYNHMTPDDAVAYIQERHIDAFSGGVNLQKLLVNVLVATAQFRRASDLN